MRKRVSRAYRSAYPEPIAGKAGDALELGGRDDQWPAFVWAKAASGREGWVPDAYLEITGSSGRLTRDYVARELTLEDGAVVEVLEETGGWAWCRSDDGELGWLPLTHLASVDG